MNIRHLEHWIVSNMLHVSHNPTTQQNINNCNRQFQVGTHEHDKNKTFGKQNKKLFQIPALYKFS